MATQAEPQEAQPEDAEHSASGTDEGAAEDKGVQEALDVRRALKMEVAEELGLLKTIEQEGWGGLSSADSGRIGARMAQILRQRSTSQTQGD